MPAIGVAAKVPDEPSVVFVREASLRFDDAMGVVFNQGPVAARIDLEDATLRAFLPATREGLCQILRSVVVGDFAGQEGACALHAPGKLRVQDVNTKVIYADPDPAAAEAAGVGVCGVDAIPVVSHLLKFEVVKDLFWVSPEGGQVVAQPLPEGPIGQALIRQDQIGRRPIVGRVLGQQRVPRRWARGGCQGRGNRFGGQFRVGRIDGGRGRHQGLWRRVPQGVKRAEGSRRGNQRRNERVREAALSLPEGPAGQALRQQARLSRRRNERWRTLLPRRPRGRERENR